MSAKSTKTPPTPATKTITITIVSLSDSLTVIIELVIAWVRIIEIDNKEKVTRIRIYKNWEEKEWLKNKNHANRKKKDERIKVDHMQNWDGLGIMNWIYVKIQWWV